MYRVRQTLKRRLSLVRRYSVEGNVSQPGKKYGRGSAGKWLRRVSSLGEPESERPPIRWPFSFTRAIGLDFVRMTRQWKLARRSLVYGERTLVMGVLNVTQDSFSDGREFFAFDRAIEQAERMIAEGADIIDVGGESTRPGSEFVSEEEELRRVIPVIERLSSSSSVPISIDTTKVSVARVALKSGAEIVNDISGLRFEPAIADEAARAKAGLILMHSRGTPKDMQQIPPVGDVMTEVVGGLILSVAIAESRGVPRESIAIDPGIGFGKTAEQNVELIAKLDQLVREFPDLPLMIGTSRKSFIGKLLDGAPAGERLHGTFASLVAAALKGVHLVRVHDVKASVEAVRVADAIKLRA